MVEKILEEFGSTIYGPACAVYWAINRIENTEQAKSELKRVNQLREKAGLMTIYYAYGHRLF